MLSESLALSTSSLDKRILYFLEKSKKEGVLLSFEELNQIMETPRATLYPARAKPGRAGSCIEEKRSKRRAPANNICRREFLKFHFDISCASSAN